VPDAMTALVPTPDMAATSPHVAVVPKAVITLARRQNNPFPVDFRDMNPKLAALRVPVSAGGPYVLSSGRRMT
jgi:hypothetical protein